DELAVQKQPRTVRRLVAGADARQPPDEVRFALVRIARQVTPFVRHDDRLLEWKEIARDQRLEKIWIGHAVDASAAEIKIEQRALRNAGKGEPNGAKIALNAGERVGKRAVDWRQSIPGTAIPAPVQRVHAVD